MEKGYCTIRALDRGYVVQVGCKDIAFDGSIDELLAKIREYMMNPSAAHRKYFPEDFLDKEKRCVEETMGEQHVDPRYNPVPTPLRGRDNGLRTEPGGY